MSIDIQTAYKTNITIPYGELYSTIEWCKSNCQQEWKFQSAGGGSLDAHNDGFYISGLDYYSFYFESERDYVAFLLWKK